VNTSCPRHIRNRELAHWASINCAAADFVDDMRSTGGKLELNLPRFVVAKPLDLSPNPFLIHESFIACRSGGKICTLRHCTTVELPGAIAMEQVTDKLKDAAFEAANEADGHIAEAVHVKWPYRTVQASVDVRISTQEETIVVAADIKG
jgi:hypothetical protein